MKIGSKKLATIYPFLTLYASKMNNLIQYELATIFLLPNNNQSFEDIVTDCILA